MEKKTLLQEWRKLAYETQRGDQENQIFWLSYFEKEKGVYKDILQKHGEKIEGKLKDLAKSYELDLLDMVGFLDGINESLVEKNPIEEMTEESLVSLVYDKELLYKNMVEAKADWLYELEEWDELIPEKRRVELYKEQRKSHTIVKERKISRNEPCPCGSGKKYKNCCGRA